MDGTTLCPHCETRFKIAVSQLEAHQGLVRCGHCLQVFDARPNFISDQPHPQLELAIEQAAGQESPEVPGEQAVARQDAAAVNTVPEAAHRDNLDFMLGKPAAEAGENTLPNAVMPAESEFGLAEPDQMEETDTGLSSKPRRGWIWATLALILFLLLLGQCAYFFRVDIAARVPAMKPILSKYCELLTCTIMLPQRSEFMSIESSSLEADPGNGAQITLTALLRNHAGYTLAFPDLELTLNDRQDKAVGRRTFKPADYLPPGESEQSGLQPNHELSLKLLLNTNDLNPNGYRLVILYPAVK